jgi:hypothetical protein
MDVPGTVISFTRLKFNGMHAGRTCWLNDRTEYVEIILMPISEQETSVMGIYGFTCCTNNFMLITL